MVKIQKIEIKATTNSKLGARVFGYKGSPDRWKSLQETIGSHFESGIKVVITIEREDEDQENQV